MSGEYLSGMRKGEHDSALFGWMSDNGDPDNFAGTLLSCDNIKSGSNVARWCDKSYDALVKSDPGQRSATTRRAIWSGARDLYQQAPWITPATGKTFYATRSNVSGYSVSLMGSDFRRLN